jgi:hypothetical protein
MQTFNLSIALQTFNIKVSPSCYPLHCCTHIYHMLDSSPFGITALTRLQAMGCQHLVTMLRTVLGKVTVDQPFQWLAFYGTTFYYRVNNSPPLGRNTSHFNPYSTIWSHFFNPLKSDFYLSHIRKLNSCRRNKKLLLQYKKQSVNAVGEIIGVFVEWSVLFMKRFFAILHV